MRIPDALRKEREESYLHFIYDFCKRSSGPNVEIEARLGRILAKDYGSRMNIRTPTPIVFEQLPPGFAFEGSVEAEDFESLKKMLIHSEFVVTKDRIEIKRDQRETYSDKGILAKAERKKRKRNIEIYFPKMKYDIRISISIEVELPRKRSNQEPIAVRERTRSSCLIEPYIFDFTEVVQRDGRGGVARHFNEVEIEIVDGHNLDWRLFAAILHNFNIPSPLQEGLRSNRP
jgi:hypothetical protein